MKYAILLVACLLGLVSCNSQTTTAEGNSSTTSQTLQLTNCRYSMELVEGTKFSFPATDTLKKLGLKLTKTATGYMLEDTAKSKDGVVTISVGDGSNNITISGGHIDNRNGTIMQSNGGNTIVVIDNNSMLSKRIKITVPKDLKLTAVLENDLFVKADLAELRLNIAGSGNASIQKATVVSSLNVSGSGNISLVSADTIGTVNVSGLGDIKIIDCQTIGDVTISGSGDVKITQAKNIGFVTVSGSGDVHLPINAQVAGKSVSGSGSIN